MRDLVCNKDVQNDEFTLKVGNNRFYFCSQDCLEKFKTNPKDFIEQHINDLIIIGAGPAGLTAAVYASTLRINTFLISIEMGGQIIDSSKIENYLGFQLISGPELIKKFEDQLFHYKYVDHVIDVVLSVKKKDEIFYVETISGETYRAHSIIVASGMQRRQLNVPGEKKFLRRGVTYNLSQDLHIFANKTVAIVGGGNSALQGILELAKYKCSIVNISIMPWIADQYLIEKVEKVSNLIVLDKHQVVEIRGEDRVEGVMVRNLENNENKFYAAEGVAIAIGYSPNSSIVKQLVDLNKKKQFLFYYDDGA